MPRKKKIVLEPAGKTLADFQSKYAGDWKKMVDSPAFQAGVQFLRNRKLDSIAIKTDEEIEKFGSQIAADLKGFIQLENEMFRLYEMTEFKLPYEEPEVYLSPEQAAEAEKQLEKYQEENRKRRYA